MQGQFFNVPWEDKTDPERPQEPLDRTVRDLSKKKDKVKRKKQRFRLGPIPFVPKFSGTPMVDAKAPVRRPRKLPSRPVRPSSPSLHHHPHHSTNESDSDTPVPGIDDGGGGSSSSSPSDGDDDPDNPKYYLRKIRHHEQKVFPADLAFFVTTMYSQTQYRVYVNDLAIFTPLGCVTDKDGNVFGGVEWGTHGHYLTPYLIDEKGYTIPFPPANAPCTSIIDPSNEDPSVVFPDPYPPNLNYSLFNRDYIVGPAGSVDTPVFLEIGRNVLMMTCEDAEKRDFQFAQKMQGLLGVSQSSVWDCLDPDFNPADRDGLLQSFLKSQTDGFLGLLQIHEDHDVRDVAFEVMRRHKTFCQEWVKRHYKNITPMIASAAENLAMKCVNVLPMGYRKLPAIVIARILWRSPITCTLFAESLYWHINSIEQTRGGRNPSYKQMSTVSNHNAQSYYKLLRSIEGQFRMFVRDSQFPIDQEIEIMFHVLSIDWYDIAGQLPEIHKHFKLPPPPLPPYQASIPSNLRQVGRGRGRPWNNTQHWNVRPLPGSIPAAPYVPPPH